MSLRKNNVNKQTNGHTKKNYITLSKSEESNVVEKAGVLVFDTSLINGLEKSFVDSGENAQNEIIIDSLYNGFSNNIQEHQFVDKK